MLNWIKNHKAMLLTIATLWLGVASGHVTISEAIAGTVAAAVPGLKLPGQMVRQAPTSTPNPRAQQ